MGLFFDYNRRDETFTIHWLRSLGAAFASSAALIGGCGGLYVNSDRQATLEVQFGKVTDVVTDSGLQFKIPLITDKFTHSLARQKVEVELQNLRMGDDIKLKSGKFIIEYEIDENPNGQPADLKKLYFDLKDQGGELDNVVEARAVDAAVRAVEALGIEDLMPEEDEETGKPKEVTADASFNGKLKKKIKDELQASLIQQGWPVKVIDVFSSGFQFEAESETKIAEIVAVRMEKVKLGLREKNAAKAKEVFRKEAEADAAYINTLRNAGLPIEQVYQALCLKMSRDAGKVNEQFSAGCGNGSNGVGVTVNKPAAPEKQIEAKPAAPAAPTPKS